MFSPSPSALRALRSTLFQFTTSITTAKSAARSIPILPIQAIRCASILADLRDVPSAHRNKKRLGRGASSGKGKTSGRGHKGQGQRSGKPKVNKTGIAFEGGQTPVIITHGTHGFENKTSKKYSPLNLERIQDWIDQGRIDPTKDITFKELVESRCLHGIKDGVKLLARGKEQLKVPINIIVSRASKDAIKRIEELGGTIVTRFFNKTGIKAVVKPELFPYGHRLANALSREDLEYYRDPAHRGYLSHTLAPGESPSLFWKAPIIAGDKGGSRKNTQLAKLKRQDTANKLF